MKENQTDPFEDTRGDWYMEKEKAMSYLDDAIQYFRNAHDQKMLDRMLDVQSFVRDAECQ